MSASATPPRAVRWPIVAAAVALGAYGQTETDIWGHLRFGLDILHAHAIPRVDTYAFTSRAPWVNHEWGSDVVFALAWSAAGLAGLALIRFACAAVTVGVLYRRLRGVAWPWNDLALLGVAILSMPLTLAVRPHDFSLPLYAVTLYALLDPARQRWLPPLFAAWANLHGGWLIGWAAVAAYAACRPSRRSIVLAAACAAATLVNPFGIHLWTALADAVIRGWGNVTEWQPVWIAAGPVGRQPLVFWAATAVAAAAALRVWQPRSLFPYVWIALVGLMSLRVQRHAPFFAIAVAALAPPLVPQSSGRRSRPASPLTTGIAAALAGAVVLAIVWPAVTCLPTRQAVPPVRPEASATAFVRSAGIGGRMLIWFDWGEYAIWQLGDRIKVSIDNRRETVYSADTMNRHVEFYFGHRPDYPDEIGADYVWLPVAVPATGQLRSRGWSVLFEGPASIVFGRTSLGPTVRATDASTRCFPQS